MNRFLSLHHSIHIRRKVASGISSLLYSAEELMSKDQSVQSGHSGLVHLCHF